MNLEYFDANKLQRKIKATIHKTGRLGFSKAAIDELELEEASGVLIAESDEGLVMKPSNGADGEFRICWAGEYCYLNAKQLFEMLSIDFAKYKVIFDLVELEDDEHGTIYKMLKRTKKKNA